MSKQTKEEKHKNNKTTKCSSKCLISKKCGGCQYIDKDYQETLDIKFKTVSRLLSNFGRVQEIIGMDAPYNYRNKINVAFKRKKNGEIVAGPYEEGTHNVLPAPQGGCLIEDRRAYPIIETIKKLIPSFKITIHNEDTGYGLLRHVMIRTAHATGQIMVVLVTASPVFPSKNNFAKALVKAHPEITTIVQNINMKDTSMVLGDRNQTMYGKGYIEDVLCGKKFRLSPNSFYQVNPVQTEKLYGKAIELAGLTGKETIIDAYSGIGTIGIVASHRAKEVIGVELNKDAVKDAITNAKLNDCRNVRFYNNDAGKFMVNMAENRDNKSDISMGYSSTVDVVFMDPPRSGSNEAFMSSVLKLAPKKVVYISCGPESLARDLKFMTKNDRYKVDKMVACDMFGFTAHCEMIVLLKKIY